MRLFSNWKIGQRLAAGFFVTIATAVAMAVLAHQELNGVSIQADRLTKDRLVKVQQLSEMKDNLNVIARGVRNIALMSNSADKQNEKQRIDDMRASNTKLISTLGTTLESDGERKLLKSVLEALTPYDSAMNKAIELGMKNEAGASADTLIKEVRPLQAAYFKAVDTLVALQAKQMRNSVDEIQSTATTGSWLMITLASAGACFGIVIAWLVTRSIVLPIRQAIGIAQTVAAGDLTSHIESARGDETGELMQALQVMNDSLARVVTQVRESSELVATGANQIAVGSMDLSQRTEEQASNLEQTAASMEELTATVNNSADTARRANELATAGIAAAGSGGSAVVKVVATMQDIAASSRKVEDIIGVIDSIAFQTNILALNAAVEAARAGEQGRGFAVVATEVRSLAQRSASAAQEIKSLIGRSVQSVELGTQQVEAAGAAVNNIVEQVRKVGLLINEISTAAIEQSGGINQIGGAVTQLDQVTQQNAALVEESAAAADSMRSQAEELVRAVSVFKLNRVKSRPA
jgi:methyl-accepting chemotaxis protein